MFLVYDNHRTQCKIEHIFHVLQQILIADYIHFSTQNINIFCTYIIDACMLGTVILLSEVCTNICHKYSDKFLICYIEI